MIWLLAGAAAWGAGWFAGRALSAGAFPGPRWASLAWLVLLLAALTVALWRFRAKPAAWLAMGAAPGLLALVVFRLFLAKGDEAMFPQTWSEMAAKVGEAGRWWQAALAFGKAIFDAGAAWTHPVLLAMILGFALRFVTKCARRARAWLAIRIAVAGAAEYGIYLIAEANLDWHISTSVAGWWLSSGPP